MNPGRDYRLFGQLAGVRGGDPIYPARGLPEKLGYEADGDWWLYLVDDGKDLSEGMATRSSAAGWVAGGSSVYRKNTDGFDTWVSDPDAHTPSWLSWQEFRRCVLAVPDCDAKWRAVVAAMGSMENEGFETRVVFWFDN